MVKKYLFCAFLIRDVESQGGSQEQTLDCSVQMGFEKYASVSVKSDQKPVHAWSGLLLKPAACDPQHTL